MFKPMDTPDLEMTMKGIGRWFAWKILFLVYLLCTALPMALYIACLLVLAIERRSTIELPIIMTAMLHPSIAIPVGIFADNVGQYLSLRMFRNQTDSKVVLIVKRLLMYSLNMHLFVIVALAYYLYAIWIPLEVASNLNFSNLPFDQCPCDDLELYNITCTNKETESSFQNIFVGVPIQPFLIALLVASIACHIIHSLILVFPSPVSLLCFYLGNFEDQIQTNEESKIKNSSNVVDEKGSNSSHKIKFVMAILTFSIFAGIVASPYLLFDAHLEKGTILTFTLMNQISFVLIYRNNLSDS